jgi:GntR family transcriptional regulator
VPWQLGPRSWPVYVALRSRILNGEFSSGQKLPIHTALAAEYGISPMTMRQVIARLEAEGLVQLRPGLGTYVAKLGPPAVLVVDDEEFMRTLLRRHIAPHGYRVVEAAGPAEGLAALESDSAIGLILSDVRMPTTAAGIQFISQVRRRWPQIPLAAVTGYADDLLELDGSPDCPVLIVRKPFRAHQLEEVLRLAFASRAARPAALACTDRE